MVVLDTCAAGAAFGDVVKLTEKRDLSPDRIRAIDLFKDSTGSWILMGSAADAVSYEASRYAQGLLGPMHYWKECKAGRWPKATASKSASCSALRKQEVGDLAKGIGGVQQPVLSAPKGQTFPIGLLNGEARKQIHLATPKLQLLRAEVFDDDDADAMNLKPAFRAALRAASIPVARSGGSSEPQIVYLDSVEDEVPDSLKPQVRYAVTGGRVNLRLRLLRNGARVVERNIESNRSDPRELAKVLLEAVLAESAKLKQNSTL